MMTLKKLSDAVAAARGIPADYTPGMAIEADSVTLPAAIEKLAYVVKTYGPVEHVRVYCERGRAEIRCTVPDLGRVTITAGPDGVARVKA